MKYLHEVMEEELKLADQFLKFYLVTLRLQKCKHHISNCSGLFSVLKGASFKHVSASTIFYLFLVMPVVIIAAKIIRSKENSSLFSAM